MTQLLVTGTRKYERGLSRLMHDDLHWLSVPQPVQAVTVYRSLRHRAPAYLADYCVPVSAVPSRHHLRSARRHQLSVPRVQRSTFGTHCLMICVIQLWTLNLGGTWRRTCSPDIWSVSALGVFTQSRFTNRHLLTYLLTYLLAIAHYRV